tara:strand:- start:5956 stop:7020 length:1065 start_codon:yes stop_codon:yes gene_type:complete
MDCEKDTILITGGTGFIGSHVCYFFLKKGFNVVSLDSLVNSSKKVNKNIDNLLLSEGYEATGNLKFVKGDIRNKDLLRCVFNDQLKKNKPISSVIHLAGLKSVKQSKLNALDYWSNNVCGSINIFNVMKEFKCNSIVFSSSATIYGISENPLIKENEEFKPQNPYGKTKATIEKILEDIFEESYKSMRISNLRYFNPIGAHPSGMIGESPNTTPENLFPYILQVACGRQKELNIYGNNWPTHDGTGVRDYIHIMDLAESHYLALIHLINNKPQILNLNIGTGIGTSVKELVNIFESVNKCNIPFVYKDRRDGDVSICVADNSYSKKVLGWIPRRNIQDMCKDGWKWMSKFPNGF